MPTGSAKASATGDAVIAESLQRRVAAVRQFTILGDLRKVAWPGNDGYLQGAGYQCSMIPMFAPNPSRSPSTATADTPDATPIASVDTTR